MSQLPFLGHKFIRLIAHVASAGPLFWMVYAAFTRHLGGDPQKALLHLLGLWGLIFLCLCLSITPAKGITGINSLVRYRRMLGLWSSAYLLLHFTLYFWLFVDLSFSELWADIRKRPYITLGMAGLTLMIPLVLTSTKGMQKRLGRNWKKLHRLVYLVAGCGVIHFLWQSKSDLNEPGVYLLWIMALFVYRIIKRK